MSNQTKFSQALIFILLPAISASACSGDNAMDTPMTGIYIECDSNNQNVHWQWHPGLCQLPGGEQQQGCYIPVAAENLAHCYKKDEWLATDTGVSGETGEAEEDEGIYRHGWPTH